MNDDAKDAIDQLANAIQTALILATRVRRNAGEQADESIQLEAAVDRAVRALSKLKPEGGTQ